MAFEQTAPSEHYLKCHKGDESHDSDVVASRFGLFKSLTEVLESKNLVLENVDCGLISHGIQFRESHESGRRQPEWVVVGDDIEISCLSGEQVKGQ